MRIVHSLMLAVLLMLCALPVQAGERENCFLTASTQYNLDPWLLVAIARVESRMRPDAVRKYPDGSEDIGLMQINSLWLPQLARYGIGRQELLHHCTSIRVAAWMIATHFFRYGKNWQAFGRYHSATPSIQARWVGLVASELRAEHPNFSELDASLKNLAALPAARTANATQPAAALLMLLAQETRAAAN